MSANFVRTIGGLKPRAVLYVCLVLAVIGDYGTYGIRSASASSGKITRMTGVAGARGATGDGPAVAAAMTGSQAIALRPSGNLLVAQGAGNMVGQSGAGQGTVQAARRTPAVTGESPTVTTITAAPTSPTSGQSVTFTVTVNCLCPESPVTTGTVTITETFMPLSSNPTTTTLGINLQLNTSGQTSVSLSNLAVGSYLITATYSGNQLDPGYQPSGTKPGVSFTVNNPTTTAGSQLQYKISTFTGAAPSATATPTTTTGIGYPQGVATDSSGNVYFASLNSVFKVNPSSGALTRIAGNTHPGYSGDGGPATSAQLNNPLGVAVDSAGNVYVADNGFYVRKISSASGTIATVVGLGGASSYPGDGGPAVNAYLQGPTALALDSAGNLYIADTYNNRIRMVSAATGTITTVAGNGTQGFSGDGGPATSAELNTPSAVAVDSSGNIYVGDSGNHRIRKVTAGVINTFAGESSYIVFWQNGGAATSAQIGFVTSLAVDLAGNVTFADQSSLVGQISATGTINTVAGSGTGITANGTYGYGGDGGPAASALLSSAVGVALDSAGNLYIADSYNSRIRKATPAVFTGGTITTSGTITTVAGNGNYNYGGDGGPAAAALLGNPYGLAVDSAGDLYIVDQFNDRIREVSGGTITTVAGNGTQGYTGDNGSPINAELNDPYAVAVDTSGNVYIADFGNSSIRKVSPGSPGTITSVVTGLAGVAGAGLVSVAVDTSANVYFAEFYDFEVRKLSGGTVTTVAGNGTQGYSGDNGAATSAQLGAIHGVAVDSFGNLYIADTSNNRVRKVSLSTGIITTFAGNGSCCYSGDGGPATSAELYPQNVAVDSAGNVYITDGTRVRVVSASTGVINTIAGNGTQGYSGDGGPATSAEMYSNFGLAIDSSGNIYVSDPANNAIRLLQPVALSVTTTSLPAAGLQTPYSQALAATGGSPSYTWSLSTGSLPAGLTLSASGTISGTPSAAGTSSFTVKVTDSANATATAGLSITVNSTPLPAITGILNGANFTAPVVAGSYSSLFGTNLTTTGSTGQGGAIWPTTLGGTTVTFAYGANSTIAAPLAFVYAGQINFQVPWELAGQITASVTVTNSLGTSSAFNVAIGSFNPGIFTVNGSGVGDVYTNSATFPGAQIQFYATGLGAVANQPADGAPASGGTSTSFGTPNVTIGGISATVVSSSLCTSTIVGCGVFPGVGAYQVTVIVPTGVPISDGVPLVLSIGGASTNTATLDISAVATGIVVLTPSPNPSTLGHAVTLTAAVTPSAATGKVTFYNGVTVLGVGTLSSGQAVLTTELLPSGSLSLRAYYGGNATYAASTSAVVTQEVTSLSQSGFQAAVNYNTGTTAGLSGRNASYIGVAVGDFNGDGKPDLVVANYYNGSTVSVLLGNGNGTFQPAVNYTVGGNPLFVAVADFNGDGKADLVVANYTGGTVSVLLGNGDGTFQAAVNYPVGSSPHSIAVADFNGDGKADLVVANYGSGTVSVLLGNGDGTFQAAVGYSTGTGPQSVVAGDFNGDGKPDLAVANYVSGTVSILLGNGDGTFQAAVNYSPGGDPTSVAVGDFNGDGKLDLAVVDYFASGSGNVSVLLGNGDGTFPAAVKYTAGTGNFDTQFVTVGDFNGDGKPDLVVANYASGTVSVLLGNGDGTFQGAVNYNAGTGPQTIAVGDFSGDGLADLAVANEVGNNVSILLGAAAITPALPPGFSAVALNFGSQAVGVASASKTVTVTNIATNSLSVTNVAASGDFSQTNNCTTVAASGTCTITVTFTPTASGSRTGGITITDNASNNPQVIRLSGVGTSGSAAIVGLSSIELNFGAQALNTTSAAKTVTLTNSGGTTLTVSSVTATGNFAQTNNCGSVAVSATCTINVTFTPTAMGALRGSVVVQESATGSPHVIHLLGTGTSATAPASGFSNVSLNFGSQATGTTSSAQTITVTNTGNATLTISAVAAAGDFAASGCVGSLAAGATCTLSVTFTPTLTGARHGTVAITDNATGSPQVIFLFGNGT